MIIKICDHAKKRVCVSQTVASPGIDKKIERSLREKSGAPLDSKRVTTTNSSGLAPRFPSSSMEYFRKENHAHDFHHTHTVCKQYHHTYMRCRYHASSIQQRKEARATNKPHCGLCFGDETTTLVCAHEITSYTTYQHLILRTIAVDEELLRSHGIVNYGAAGGFVECRQAPCGVERHLQHGGHVDGFSGPCGISDVLLHGAARKVGLDRRCPAKTQVWGDVGCAQHLDENGMEQNQNR